MKFNKLNVPTHWQNYWTRYPEGHTILEALISWVSQVDNMVDNVNSWNDYLDNFVATFDKELQKTVTDTLSEWQDTGFINVVISEALEWELDNFKATTEQNFLSVDQQIQQTEQSINAELAQIVQLAPPPNGNDDTSNLNTFFASDYRKVKLLEGTYLITRSVKIPSNIAIEIPKGTTIKLKDNAAIAQRMLDARESDNIHIFGGGTIDGNATGTQPNEQKTHGIGLVSKNVVIENITIKNIACYMGSMGDAINCEANMTTLKQCENIIIRNCRFENMGRQDIAFESGINCVVDSNFFIGGLVHAIDCEPMGYTYGRVDGITITNNICRDKLHVFDIVTAEPPTKLQNIIIANNQTFNCQNILSLRSAKNVRVTDNLFNDCGGDYLVSIYANNGTINDNIHIENNTFTGTATNGIRSEVGVNGTIKNIYVINNNIQGVRGKALDLNSITNVVVLDNDCDGLDSVAGIIYTNLCDEVVIKRNKVKCIGQTGQCIRVVNSTDLEIGGNKVINGDYGIALQNVTTIHLEDNKHINNTLSKVGNLGGNSKWLGVFTGTFTLTTSSHIQNILDKRVESNSIILLTPMSKDANTVMNSTKAIYVIHESNAINTSFRIATGDGTTATGTPIFYYTIINE